MTGAHARDPHQAVAAAERTPRRWRLATPAVVLLSGALFAISATNSAGTDLRPGRYTDLAALVETEADAYEAKRDTLAQLDADIDRLTDDVDDKGVRRLRRESQLLEDPAGLTDVIGAGIRITLSDSPDDVLEQAITAKDDLRPLVVHQQDIQAVVNAMWAAGAQAVTLQGQRIISTTGIKCEGNAVQLHGLPYAEPYVIEGVGDPTAILAALDADQTVTDYLAQSEDPAVAIGWELTYDDQILAPAYGDVVGMRYAKPL